MDADATRANPPLDWLQKPARRERRVDVLRGIALVCIFADHIPGNALNWITLRNFGFSDAAELFVMLAGFASMMAYGRSFARDGARTGLRKILLRCARLWVFQIGLLIATICIVWFWDKDYGRDSAEIAPIVHRGVHGLVGGLILRSQPSNLNILPLYIILLGLFPVIYAGLRLSLSLTLLVSGALWFMANAYPKLNLINTFDGSGWFFDPFAWQFLFAIGAAMASIMAQRDGTLPRWPWLVALCWVFLAFGFFEAFPWGDWNLPNLAPLEMDAPDKTYLAPLRLLHALALVYVVLSWRGWTGSGRSLLLRGAELCGRHSLEVFSVGTVLALIGKLSVETFGSGWEMQIGINVVGFAVMLGVAWMLEGARKRSMPAPLPHDPQSVQILRS